MSYAISFNDAGFNELNSFELNEINGGGWGDVFNASVGSILIGHALVLGVAVSTATGVGAAAVGAYMLYNALK